MNHPVARTMQPATVARLLLYVHSTFPCSEQVTSLSYCLSSALALLSIPHPLYFADLHPAYNQYARALSLFWQVSRTPEGRQAIAKRNANLARQSTRRESNTCYLHARAE